MAANKTIATDADVQAYLDAIPDPARRRDCATLVALMGKLVGAPPVMWGAAIVGFGRYHYRYDSGREGEAPLLSFSSRKNDLSIYLVPEAPDLATCLPRLGKHKMGKSCLQLPALAGVDLSVLEELLQASVRATRERYGA